MSRWIATFGAALIVASSIAVASPVAARSHRAAGAGSAAIQAPVSAAGTPKFLTLPFASASHIQVQQAWDFANGQHQAIDYIKGAVDNTSTWRGFPVVAAADGWACGDTLKTKGCIVRPGVMGKRVAIRHKVNGKVFTTFYNHLRTIEPSIPIGDKHNRVPVKRGQVIGYAGHSGNPSYLIHLHFQLLNQRLVPKDPYGLYGNRADYPDPKGTNGNLDGPNDYWTTNPPTLPPAEASAAGRPSQPGYITHGPRTDKVIALTFDADMYPWMYANRDSYHEYDERMLKLLKNQDVPATIFFNGLYVKAYPDVVQDLLAGDPYLEVGNQSWDHAGWTDTCGNTDPIQPPMTKTLEVTKAATKIQKVTGVAPYEFRFPGGCYGGRSDLRLVKRQGERPIGWDCYFGDALGWSAARQVANVKQTCQRGSIVITHLNNTKYHPGVYRALKQLLPWWKDHGWTVVSVGELLENSTAAGG